MSHQRAGPSSGPGSEPPFHVMLTCYTLFERDSTEQKLDRKFLRGWDWSHLILDEAHAVKNSSAMRTVRLNKCAPSALASPTPCGIPFVLWEDRASENAGPTGWPSAASGGSC